MRLGCVTVVMLQMYPTVIIILCHASGPRKVSDCNVIEQLQYGRYNFMSSTVGMNGKLVF